jgi:hypothetical protein
VPALCLARCAAHQPLSTRLEAVQSFISSFQYNACTGCNYNCAKQRPLHAILATAAGILTQSLPIKCIGEATHGAVCRKQPEPAQQQALDTLLNCCCCRSCVPGHHADTGLGPAAAPATGVQEQRRRRAGVHACCVFTARQAP